MPCVVMQKLPVLFVDIRLLIKCFGPWDSFLTSSIMICRLHWVNVLLSVFRAMSAMKMNHILQKNYKRIAFLLSKHWKQDCKFVFISSWYSLIARFYFVFNVLSLCFGLLNVGVVGYWYINKKQDNSVVWWCCNNSCNYMDVIWLYCYSQTVTLTVFL